MWKTLRLHDGPTLNKRESSGTHRCPDSDHWLPFRYNNKFLFKGPSSPHCIFAYQILSALTVDRAKCSRSEPSGVRDDNHFVHSFWHSMCQMRRRARQIWNSTCALLFHLFPRCSSNFSSHHVALVLLLSIFSRGKSLPALLCRSMCFSPM